jgi:hypothetical protein
MSNIQIVLYYNLDIIKEIKSTQTLAFLQYLDID